MNVDVIGPMTEREFRSFRTLVYEQSGIRLNEQKRELLAARLARRLRTLGLNSYSDYLEVVDRHRSERDEMLDRVVTNETHFFREPQQFEFLEKALIPRWKLAASRRERNAVARIWSAGCSTGQEPYSLAMTLLAALPEWTIEILASDISFRALRQASEGLWPAEKAAEIPRSHLEKFMLRGVRTQSGFMKANDALRSVLRFQRINLNETLPSDLGTFDLLFCRNVLIYFDPESRARAIARLLAHLREDGLLFLGHSESLLNSGHALRPVAPSVYTRRNGR